MTVYAGIPDMPYGYGEGSDSAFNMDEQFDALGREELESHIPPETRELMRKSGDIELSAENLLQLSPHDFFRTIWDLLLERMAKPIKTLAAVVGIVVVCALIGGLKTASGEDSLSQTLTMVATLCILTSVLKPILDCIAETSKTIQDAALFMLSYIPIFSAALAASGSAITSATYNLFLFSTSQIISQVIDKTLIPLMGIYLALCIIGSLAPDINISSASASVKSIISWTLGFFLTVFVGLLSVQTMVAQSADTVTIKTAKFMLGSFVPIVGSALSDAVSTAQGCFKLIKTTLGAYGVIVSIFMFLPALLETMIWYLFTNIAVIAGDIIGVPRISEILRSCASVLGILVAITLCFALLLIISTVIVMVTGLGTA